MSSAANPSPSSSLVKQSPTGKQKAARQACLQTRLVFMLAAAITGAASFSYSPKEVLNALAVVGKQFAPVELIDGLVERAMGFAQIGWHRI